MSLILKIVKVIRLLLEPKACGRPEQPPNSTMLAQNFNVGTTIEYICDEGHLLVGPTSRTCLDTGFYNEFPPVCKSKLAEFIDPDYFIKSLF